MDKGMCLDIIEELEDKIKELKVDIYLLEEKNNLLKNELHAYEYKNSWLQGRLSRHENNIEYLLENGKITEEDLL